MCWCNRIANSVMLFVNPRLLFPNSDNSSSNALISGDVHDYTRNSGALFLQTPLNSLYAFSYADVCCVTSSVKRHLTTSPWCCFTFLVKYVLQHFTKKNSSFFVSSTTMISRFEFSITHFSSPIPHLVFRYTKHNSSIFVRHGFRCPGSEKSSIVI